METPINKKENDVKETQTNTIAKKVEEVDFYYYSGPIYQNKIDEFIEYIITNKKNNTIRLILTTYGGDPDSSFRLVSMIKNLYTKFELLIFGHCKSAGTFIALGADELYFSKTGELGPLDVQMAKEDGHKGESGTDLLHAFATINNEYLTFLTKTYNSLRQSITGLSFNKALDTAEKITSGLFVPIMNKIEPLAIGQTSKSQRIALKYKDLMQSANVNNSTFQSLLYGYPSHSFVINKKEAEKYFYKINNIDVDIEKVYNSINKFLEAKIFECVYGKVDNFISTMEK